ncbi:cupin domain-containing protein [Deinococcus sp. YIM 77859]|uniref:cupin domain-containing protein n=1 Tax=Deinococcus sp. YIM 77859 TaxID=1540221 RepID=UPI0005540DD1|nr:cupin domain-containing protein [Deinococcus sp. YIM 77859]
MSEQNGYRVSRDDTTRGENGEHHLIRGEHGSMRLWLREEPNADKPERSQPYETLGYVIEGRMDLIVNGETVSLGPGDSYRVPRNTPHTFRIKETLTAVEVTAPPADR